MDFEKIEMVVSDIDGTLLNDNHELTESVKKEIRRIIDMGYKFVLASARPPFAISPIVKEIERESISTMCYNGALVFDKDQRIIVNNGIDSTLVSFYIQKMKKCFPSITINLYSNDKWYVEKLSKWTDLETKITDVVPEIENFTDLLTIHNIPIHKLLIIGEKDEVNRLFSYLDDFSHTEISVTLSKENYLEINSIHATKLKGIRKLNDQYGVDLDNTLAIGDSFNDLEMIQEAGIGVAMANSTEEVRRQASFVAKSNEENGLALILNNLTKRFEDAR